MANRSWPVILLGLASFMPGLGLIAGAAAVIWAVSTNPPRAKLAIGLGVTGAGIQVVGGIVMTVWLLNSDFMREATQARAAKDLAQIVVTLDQVKETTGHYPPTLLALALQVPATDSLNVLDLTAGLAARQPYAYHIWPNEAGYDVFAAGGDRKLGTSDDIRPILPDSQARHSGYRPPP